MNPVHALPLRGIFHRGLLDGWQRTRASALPSLNLLGCAGTLIVMVVFSIPSPAMGQSGSLFQPRGGRPVSSTTTGALPGQVPTGTESSPAPFPQNGANGSGNGAVPMLPPNASLAAPPNIASPFATVTDPAFAEGIPNPLQSASWTLGPPVLPRTLKIHDIVSIRVDDLASTNSQGNAQSRKTGLYDARLNDWIEFVGWDTIKPSPQDDGDPRIQGQQNEVYRASSNLQTREQMTFNIAAEIADIRPNGTIVLSARKTIRLNDNVWEASLSGVCRAQDIGPDNVVLSRNISELVIDKNDRGHVRDGYSRGWFTRWLARFKPF